MQAGRLRYMGGSAGASPYRGGKEEVRMQNEEEKLRIIQSLVTSTPTRLKREEKP
jgi:hypothetical protein